MNTGFFFNGRSFLESHLGFALAVLVWLGSTRVGVAQEDEVAAGGRFAYQTYCATCHGVTGKGDGVMANQLLIKPADLTQLAKVNDGKFPFWRTYGVIDGREEVKGHGPRAMPIWGDWFQRAKGSELLATGRILELVHYLKSIQK